MKINLRSENCYNTFKLLSPDEQEATIQKIFEEEQRYVPSSIYRRWQIIKKYYEEIKQNDRK